MAERFRVIMRISRRGVTLLYRQGNGEPEPFPGCEWPQPLALMVSGNEVILGSEAASAAAMGNDNAIPDYFESIKHPRRVALGAGTTEVRQLLLHAFEERLKDLLETQFFGQEGSVEENRNTMPFLIATEPDVASNEKDYLLNLFGRAGYKNLQTVAMDSMVCRCLRHEDKPLLLVNSDGKDLHLTLSLGNGACKTLSIADAGTDPRVAKVADSIWEDIRYNITDPDREREDELLRAEAVRFLRSGKREWTEYITLSNGMPVSYWVQRPRTFQNDSPLTNHIKYSVENFLKSNGIPVKDHVELLLWGNTAGNAYFRDLLSAGFLECGEQNEENTKLVRRFLAAIEIVPAPPVFTNIKLPRREGITPHKRQASCTETKAAEEERGTITAEERSSITAEERGTTKTEEWTELEEIKLRKLVVPAEAAMRSGKTAKVLEALAELKQLAAGRAWPATAQTGKAPWNERIKALEAAVKQAPQAEPTPKPQPKPAPKPAPKPVQKPAPKPAPKPAVRMTPPPVPPPIPKNMSAPTPPPIPEALRKMVPPPVGKALQKQQAMLRSQFEQYRRMAESLPLRGMRKKTALTIAETYRKVLKNLNLDCSEVDSFISKLKSEN